jgi:HPt (histidine-containing phosphotransfer) domain-containing protein
MAAIRNVLGLRHADWWQVMVASDQEVLDRAVLEELRDAAGGDAFLEIAQTFTEQIGLIVERLVAPECLADLDCLERNAHELAGAAGTFGAPSLTTQARAVMAACRENDGAAARDQIAPLVTTAQTTLDAFNRYCQELP